MHLMNNDLMKALVNSLSSKDSKVLNVCLEGVSNILKAGLKYFSTVTLYIIVSLI